MTALAIATEPLQVPIEVEQETLARIDGGGLHICEAELRYQLRWSEQNNGPLLDLLDELERRELIESGMHFRLTEKGRAQLPAGYVPRWRHGTGIPWKVRSESGPHVARPEYRDTLAPIVTRSSGESHERREPRTRQPRDPRLP